MRATAPVLEPAILAAGAPGWQAGVFEDDAYLRASAAHEGATLWRAGTETALALLRGVDGGFHTVYGYANPHGADVARLADELLTLPSTRIALSPLGGGARLAETLGERVRPVSVRPICISDLTAGDPVETFAAGSRKMVERAVRGGATVEVGEIERWFGAFYRAAMDALSAAPVYRFADAYFAAIASLGFQVTVRDADGIAAAAVFLVGDGEATYHLSGRRVGSPAVPGATNLLVAEGLRESARRGAQSCILGGGRGIDADDPLFRFKRGMATHVVARPTFELREGSR